MKCPKCGADSEVDATRKYKDVLLKRSRRCFNGHPFQTYEVHAGNLDRRTLADTRRGVETKAKSWALKARILRDTRSSAEVAEDVGCSAAYVRLVRNQA